MAAAVIYDEFRSAGALLGTSAPTKTNVSYAQWSNASSSGFIPGMFARTADGCNVRMPDAGQTTVAQLDTDSSSPLHSTAGGGVTVVECNMQPGGFLGLAMEFEDELLKMSCTAAGAWTIFNNSTNVTGTTTAPSGSVTYRIEVTTTAVRFYVNNTLVYTRGSGIPAGYVVTYVRMGYDGVAGTPGYAAGSTQLAFGYLHLKTEVASGPLGGPALGGGDTTPPTFTSSTIVVSALYDQYTVTWPPATDNSDLPAALVYEYRINGGAWASNGNSTTLTRTGRTPGSTEAVDIRVKDTAGNISTTLSTAVSLFPLPTTTQLFGDNFTLAGVLRGSTGQTGKWSKSLWYTNATFFGRGGDNIPGNEQPGSWTRNTDALKRTASGLGWLGEGDVTTITAYVHPVTPAEVELPLVMEVGAWGDFSMGFGGPGLPGVVSGFAALTNMADGTARIYANIPPGGGWVAGGPSEPNYRAIPPISKDQYNILKIELTLTAFRVYLNGTLVGTAPRSSPSSTPKILYWWVTAYTHETGLVSAARGLTRRDETLLKFDYVNLYAGRLDAQPLGPPRDPNDDPLPPGPGPGPGNEPKDGYSLFWTGFNKTYEVP